MELPTDVQHALDAALRGHPRAALQQAAEALSRVYRDDPRRATVPTSTAALAYAAARMPATYAAAYHGLSHALACTLECPQTLLDIGSGPGSMALAARELLPLKGIICLEQSPAMLEAARLLAAQDEACPTEYIEADLRQRAFPTAELVTAAYVLGELAGEAQATLVSRMWAACQTMALFIEPGTPKGFQTILAARAQLLGLGAHIAAPCPHTNACPMEASGDWCHFTCRVARSALHKRLKGGEAPFEDEKFAYLAVTRAPALPTARILRHPHIQKGRVGLTLCTQNGMETRTISKSQGEAYRLARRAGTGDAWEN